MYYLNLILVFGLNVVRMQGAKRFAVLSKPMVVRVANSSATPQMGDFPPEHHVDLCLLICYVFQGANIV
jgi:hypothetical protein